MIEILNRYTQAVLLEAVRSVANLGEANLRGADLREIREDFEDVLSSAPAEAPALVSALKEGKGWAEEWLGAPGE
jgi:hypothetical protein